MVPEWKYAVVTGGKTTVETVPCIIGGVYINIPPPDDGKVSDDTTRVFVLPSGAAVGNCYGFDGTRFETSLVVNAGGGDVTVVYWIMGDDHK